MDIQSAEKKYQQLTFGDDGYRDLLDHLQEAPLTNHYHLCLLAGPPAKPKSEALQQISEKSNRDIEEVDANGIISKIESETYKNMEDLFARFSADESLLYINNGARFNGEYTGYTNSKVKYATPQERYFLNKMQKKGGLYVVNLADNTDGDTTLHRAANSIIHFPAPQSGFKKMMWKLKHVSVHGHQIETKRPQRYGNQTDNF